MQPEDQIIINTSPSSEMLPLGSSETIALLQYGGSAAAIILAVPFCFDQLERDLKP
ncbi:hypothetical protein [Moorena sp. SIO3B2]|uniref:hypothetical protein n=1 Tax=Moorena sp. SIO3B2 TaxID=2607827 RepID=UPI0013C634FC|nr:hypothetical protein [Moorena sp. SIO3B2]NEP33618.1 hypothetical protein [Moorena sp. SIO3B2]